MCIIVGIACFLVDMPFSNFFFTVLFHWPVQVWACFISRTLRSLLNKVGDLCGHFQSFTWSSHPLLRNSSKNPQENMIETWLHFSKPKRWSSIRIVFACLGMVLEGNFSWTYHKWSKLDSVFPTRYFIPCRYMTVMFEKHPIMFLYVGSF